MSDDGEPGAHMMVRYCRSCDTEFQPHVVRCSDCGGELEDAWPDEGDSPAVAAPPGADEIPAEYVVVARDITPRMAARAGRRLTAAGIPFRLAAPTHYGFHLGVPTEQAAAATVVLEKARAIPRQPSPDDPAVGETGGPCPACGAIVTPGAAECPDCGLGIGTVQEAPTCPTCGRELPSPASRCHACSC
jgi:hypothetical protein